MPPRIFNLAWSLIIITLIIFGIAYSSIKLIHFLINETPLFLGVAVQDNKGQVGDIIGGIVGPIINLAGMILVYLSFREQFVANEVQRKTLNTELDRFNHDADINSINEIYKEIRADINEIEIDGPILTIRRNLKGFEALKSYFSRLFDMHAGRILSESSSINSSLYLIIYNFSEILVLIHKARIHQNEKRDLRVKVYTFYYWHLGQLIDELIKDSFVVPFFNDIKDAKLFKEMRNLNFRMHLINNEHQLIEIPDDVKIAMKQIGDLQ